MAQKAPEPFAAPQPQLFALIIDGILGGKLEWGLVVIGVLIAVSLELAGVSALPFAVGMYLPLSASTPIFVGGVLRWLADRTARQVGLGGRDGNQPRRAAVQRLHRRRHALRPDHRVLRVPAGSLQQGSEPRQPISSARITPTVERRTRRSQPLVMFLVLAVVLLVDRARKAPADNSCD